MNQSLEKHQKALLLFWIFTLLVILWGAWVRISHSGNGCGDHWPMCQGELIPSLNSEGKTWVEYSHRLMSGIYGLIVIGFLWFYRKKSFSPMTRKLSWALFVLMIIEAGLGALLVKKGLVTVDDSVFRLVAMSLHQLNSFLLTGTTYLFAFSFTESIRFRKSYPLLLILVLCMTGAIAALSTTLFPSYSLWEGILQDLHSESHLFIRLRILHPLFAVATTLGLMTYFYLKNNHRLVIEIFIALFVGLITLLTLSPVWLKLTHLLIAHVLWARLIKNQLIANSCDSKSL